MAANALPQGSSAVVTGAGGALGRAISFRLGSDGFAVGVLGRESAHLRETADLLTQNRVPHRVLPVDLRDGAALDAALSETEEELGPLGALVNNAAIYPSTPLFDISQAEFEDVVRVNQTAYFLAAQGASRRMAERGTGAIVNIGSITFHGGWANLASYVTTKGAAVGMTRALARELGPLGIRVNGVSPGAFPTKAEEIHESPAQYSAWVIDRQSLKRRGTDAELAAVVSFLVSPDSSFVTGQTINVDGGWIME
ncbi:NAD(P)-dependent dehydrogenase (short-subunit alcohol dehydrogenase family) [Microbacterium sp. SLBN-154]|uniref:SDR family NAD(P)-dependent oxidoreductase n=1 Tax=Microbacterium sp. SLBN-154 TaxID=2768458 RepID=UPI0011692862|nr:SDR family NAD(P)-dependent oxidoreductase [Microbacterium sp. SLBN-154]TQK17686.1 NAD(P)-dependent dehydrogenase (short-subunit alcohol dehydrogenase family) [Microbacterium sp. SLBN-154]